VTVRLLGRAAVAVGRPRSGITRHMARYAGALVVVDLAFTVVSVLDPMLIGAFLGAAAVGQFSAPARLVAFLHYPGYALANGIAPRLARHESEERRDAAFATGLRYLILLYAALAVPFAVWGEPIAGLLLGGRYDESGDVLRALAGLIFLSGLAPLVSLSVNYLGEARRRVPVALAAVAINAAVSIVLIREIGIVGAAIGSTAAYAFYVLGHLLICRRRLELALRPMLLAFGRALVAATAMAGVLLVAGTDDLSLAAWLLAPPAAAVVYVAVLVASGELSRDELRAASRRLRRKR
jgi:O-antigen/teichoic acid export membrane protein